MWRRPVNAWFPWVKPTHGAKLRAMAVERDLPTTPAMWAEGGHTGRRNQPGEADTQSHPHGSPTVRADYSLLKHQRLCLGEPQLAAGWPELSPNEATEGLLFWPIVLRPAQRAGSSRRRDGLGGAEVAVAQAAHRHGGAAEEVVEHSVVGGRGAVDEHGNLLGTSRWTSPTETFVGEPHRQLKYHSIV